MEQLDQLTREFSEIQRQIINEVDEPSVADATAEAEFEERYLAVRVVLKRIINASRGSSIEANLAESSNAIMLMQLLQRQMEIMERRETNESPQLRTTSSAQEPEVDGPLGALLRTQTEILQRLSDGPADSVTGGSRIKLPTIKLPTFDGKIEEWTHFSDAFMQMIHNNQALPSIQKFIYLRSSLSGAASRVIEDIELSDDNYTVAWEQLQRRYEDSGIVKRRHIQCLFEMPSVDKESASAILRLVDHVGKHTRVLKRLGAPTESWSDLLLYMVEGKLDRTTLRAWEERASHGGEGEIRRESSFDDLVEFLVQRCHALERMESSKSKANSESKGISKTQGQGKSNQSKSLDKVMSLTSAITPLTCFVCNEPHLIYNCTKFLAMSTEERLKEARRLNCLRSDHFAKNCKHGSCRKCTGKHNTLLHRDAAEGQHIASGKQPTAGRENSDSGTDNDTKTVCHSSNSLRCNVFMATAIVDVTNPEGFSLPFRVLLDSGSEANFITQSACNEV